MAQQHHKVVWVVRFGLLYIPTSSALLPTLNPSQGVRKPCSEGNQTVYFYDNTTANRAGGSKGARKGAPQAPTSLADAQQKLKDKKDAKPEEDEPYVYLPPGSSMRE